MWRNQIIKFIKKLLIRSLHYSLMNSEDKSQVKFPPLSIEVADKFYELCNWVYEVWATHRFMFDDNPDAEYLKKSIGGEFLGRLSVVTQEYVLHQIVKLHDPAVQRGGDINLGIDYVIKSGDWPPDVLNQLKQLNNRLDLLSTKLRGVRNKILSHNDFPTIMENSPLGSFPAGLDLDYFDSLQQFVNIVHNHVKGVPAPFNDLAINDVVGFLGMFRRNET